MAVARIKPFNPRKGYKLRTFTVYSQTFKVDEGWYKVDDTTAKYLKEVHNEQDPDAPLAFDVCETAEDALKLEAAQRAAQRTRGEPRDPLARSRVDLEAEAAASTTLTTRDLPKADPVPRRRSIEDTPATEDDLDADDLAAQVARERRSSPRKTRLVNPTDEGTAVEGDPDDGETGDDEGQAADAGSDSPDSPPPDPGTAPAAPSGPAAAPKGARRPPGAPKAR